MTTQEPNEPIDIYRFQNYSLVFEAKGRKKE